ncbi:MAG TPA: WxcM-like domain-containing protein [Pseudomonadales bacterium]|nr:WxcM-like domain-containing protein [Pseudomonadales bacterium]HRG49932.1 WxcM-like domain-containing protein [Pseudomonadales bacterium]
MDYFVHEQGICESKNIGSNTRVWAFSHILPNAVIGKDCNICDHVFIENDVTIGDRVTIKNGVQIWDGIIIEDDVFVGSNATFTNDPFPRSKQHLKNTLKTTVGRGASIGANATLLPGINIGQNAMIGAGAVVTRSVPAHAIVMGNPARIVGYANEGKQQKAVDVNAEFIDTEQLGVRDTQVNGVTLHTMPLVLDLRGNLTAGEFEQHIPFVVKRYFMVFDVPSAETRGEHAHKKCHQFLICVKGSVSVVADDGKNRQEFLLQKPNQGIFLPAGIWGVQYKYSADAVLLVFASEVYSAEDYIRDYNAYLDYLAEEGCRG